MLTRAHGGGARRQSSFFRLSDAPSGTRRAAGTSLPTFSRLMTLSRHASARAGQGNKRNGASSTNGSETQRRHTSARSQNERARGALFESKRTRRCGSSETVAMAAIKRSRESSRSGENKKMEDFGG